MDADLSPARPAPAERTRALSYLFLGGALLGTLAIVFLPLPAGTNIPGTLATFAVAVIVGFALLFASDRIPGWVTIACLAAGTAIVSLDIYFARGFRTNDEMFYLWVAFYAFYFLTIRQAICQLALIGVGYAIAITLRDAPDASTRWVITIGTLAVAGMLIRRLVAQLERWAERTGERERALREAEERFRSAFDEAAIGMALVGLDGRWLRVNDALARLTGYPAEQLVGMGFRDITPDERGAGGAATWPRSAISAPMATRPGSR